MDGFGMIVDRLALFRSIVTKRPVEAMRDLPDNRVKHLVAYALGVALAVGASLAPVEATPCDPRDWRCEVFTPPSDR